MSLKTSLIRGNAYLIQGRHHGRIQGYQREEAKTLGCNSTTASTPGNRFVARTPHRAVEGAVAGTSLSS